MNWTRKHHENIDPANFKEWGGGCGKYSIIWRNQVGGSIIASGYYACVRKLIPGYKFGTWVFVDLSKQPLLHTLQTAKDACEKHADLAHQRLENKE